MAQTRFIIKGAFYFNGSEILKAHYTGEFWMVDCTQWKLKKEIKQNYGESFCKNCFLNDPIIYEGKKYYECEYSPMHTDDMILISDLSELEHNEENFNF